MRMAIVHDWLVVNGGAEKVLREIIACYPEADIFTLVDFLDEESRQRILGGRETETSFIQHLPFASRHFRHYLPLFPKAIESLDLRGYDVILSSSWAVAKGVKRFHPHTVHICYCHTPIRYAWDLYEEYTAGLAQPKRFLVEQSLAYIRRWDRATVDRVDFFIANSHFVKERIARIYQREATVIYPPVDIEHFTLQEEKEGFYLSASRLVPYKKIAMIVDAFNQMPNHELVVIGSGEEEERIRAIAGKNIRVLGYQPDAVLRDYMQRAKGFVYAAIEDFGIIPIEAMACGTPVIALNQGGTAETVTDGVTGVHFASQQPEAIQDAIKRFEGMVWDARRIRQEAERYGHFQARFREVVEATLPPPASAPH